MVTTEVSGNTPVGNRSRPMMLFINELLPRLNWPNTARVKRSSANFTSNSRHC